MALLETSCCVINGNHPTCHKLQVTRFVQKIGNFVTCEDLQGCWYVLSPTRE